MVGFGGSDTQKHPLGVGSAPEHHGKDQFVFATRVELAADQGLQCCIRKGADEAEKSGSEDDITHAGIENDVYRVI